MAARGVPPADLFAVGIVEDPRAPLIAVAAPVPVAGDDGEGSTKPKTRRAAAKKAPAKKKAAAAEGEGAPKAKRASKKKAAVA